MNAQPAQGVHVLLYSADLARMPDGSWMILSSRADAPGGIGYALENRIVVGQTLPELFGDMGVQRLASFFNSHREYVLSLAQSRKGRAVLLTPGPQQRSLFRTRLSRPLSRSFAGRRRRPCRARRAGIPETLVGLERVAVIFRRRGFGFLRPRSNCAAIPRSAFPGLVDAVCAGNVVLANALGGGVMESPAMDAYLPGLSRALLGEDLKIPDIPHRLVRHPMGPGRKHCRGSIA